MPRLPIPGGDNDTWGDILNEYLAVSLGSDGSLAPGSVNPTQLNVLNAPASGNNLTYTASGFEWVGPSAHNHTEFARLDGATFTGEVRLQEYTESVTTPTVSTTTTINCVNGMTHRLTLNQNTTLAITGLSPTAGLAQTVSLFIKQDATGGRTVTWPTGVRWPNGIAPSLVTSANAENVVSLTTFDSGTSWYGFPAGMDMR